MSLHGLGFFSPARGGSGSGSGLLASPIPTLELGSPHTPAMLSPFFSPKLLSGYLSPRLFSPRNLHFSPQDMCFSPLLNTVNHLDAHETLPRTPLQLKYALASLERAETAAAK